MPLKVKNNEEYNLYHRQKRREKKEELIKSLGAKCENCKDTRIEFLGVSKGRVLCFNCRDFLKRKKVETKRIKK